MVAKPVIESVMDGFNGTLFAYGQVIDIKYKYKYKNINKNENENENENWIKIKWNNNKI